MSKKPKEEKAVHPQIVVRDNLYVVDMVPKGEPWVRYDGIDPQDVTSSHPAYQKILDYQRHEKALKAVQPDTWQGVTADKVIIDELSSGVKWTVGEIGWAVDAEGKIGNFKVKSWPPSHLTPNEQRLNPILDVLVPALRLPRPDLDILIRMLRAYSEERA